MNIKLNNKVYDVAKWVCLIGIPAVSVLYIAIADIWGLSYTAEVTGTLDAIAVFIGAVIGISTKTYNKGESDEKEN